MKKILTILLFVAMIFGVSAQEYNPYEPHYHAFTAITIGDNAMASDNYSYPWTCQSTVFSTGMSFQYPITELTSIKLDGTLNLGKIGGDLRAMILVGTSVNFHATEHIYWHVNLLPRMIIHGDGVQTNGDVLDFWITLATGPGFEWKFGNNELFVECGISKGIDVISHYNIHHDDVFMMATIGYRYRIL